MLLFPTLGLLLLCVGARASRLLQFNPAGCDFIASGKHFTYSIYASIFLTYQEAKERCTINHRSGRLAWMSDDVDSSLLEDVLIYLGYINMNVDYWIDGVPANPSNPCEGVNCAWTVERDDDVVQSHIVPNRDFVFQALNLHGEKNASRLAPVIRLVAHKEERIRSVKVSDWRTNMNGFICSMKKQFAEECPSGYKKLGDGFIGVEKSRNQSNS